MSQPLYKNRYLQPRDIKPYSYLSSIAEQMSSNITSSRNTPRHTSNTYRPFSTLGFGTTKDKQKLYFETITPYVEPDSVTSAKVIR